MMNNIKIIKEDFPTTKPLYYIKIRHPWFKFIWMYLGKYTWEFHFTRINDKTNFNSIEDVFKRIKEFKEMRERTFYEHANSYRRVIKIGNLNQILKDEEL